jgi:threonyl-tRNA synthetase
MSITITLPDGSERSFDSGATALDVATDISPRLASATLAARIDDILVDATTVIDDGAHTIALITDRDETGLEVLRHTAAHILAQAVCRLYGPQVQYSIGPALMDDFQYGFYYDFDLPESISTDDLEKIQAEMKKIASEKLPLERIELSVADAKAQFTELGQGYKCEMIDDLVATEGVETVTLYRQGEFLDMCRGPHLPTTGKAKVFKLLTTAGAYWRGDERNKMLTRIYGTAFFDKKELAAHLERIEEARKRDHRVLGKQLGLFTFSDQVGSGLPLWMPKGATIRLELETWMREQLLRRGYQPVNTPHIGKLDLYRTSGHYPYYEHGLFPTLEMDDGESYLLKPMNCPHHIQIFKATQHSYRDLPERLAEFGTVYRYEQSGQLNGLTRVRGFTQDDAHIFCTAEQLESEIESCVELTQLVLSTLGLNDYRIRLGLRDPDAAKYTGDPANWDRAEENIRNVVKRLGMNYTEEAGEAAFYGPKIDFVVRDCIGREWQLGTIQVDYNLPERFELEYIGADNAPHRPIMIHRAPLGSPERFIGILIEHFAGAFPLWLAPEQVAVLPVSDKYNDYAAEITAALHAQLCRVKLDNSPEKIGSKIRRATLDKIPYMLILGEREVADKSVSVRHRTAGDAGAFSLPDFLNGLKTEIDSKGHDCPLEPTE